MGRLKSVLLLQLSTLAGLPIDVELGLEFGLPEDPFCGCDILDIEYINPEGVLVVNGDVVKKLGLPYGEPPYGCFPAAIPAIPALAYNVEYNETAALLLLFFISQLFTILDKSANAGLKYDGWYSYFTAFNGSKAAAAAAAGFGAKYGGKAKLGNWPLFGEPEGIDFMWDIALRDAFGPFGLRRGRYL